MPTAALDSLPKPRRRLYRDCASPLGLGEGYSQRAGAMINGVPPVNPKFDPQAVMAVADLQAQNFRVVGSWQVVNDQMTIAHTPPDDNKGWIIAFEVSDEVAVLTATERRLADRLQDWEKDVTSILQGTLQPRDAGQRTQCDCLAACTARYGQGTIYAKHGTRIEKAQLLRQHHPRCNRSDNM
jgi:hypothetical protein